MHRVRETERENERRLWLWTSDHQRGLARGPDHRCDLVGRTDPSVHQVRKTHLEKPCLRLPGSGEDERASAGLRAFTWYRDSVLQRGPTRSPSYHVALTLHAPRSTLHHLSNRVPRPPRGSPRRSTLFTIYGRPP